MTNQLFSSLQQQCLLLGPLEEETKAYKGGELPRELQQVRKSGVWELGSLTPRLVLHTLHLGLSGG